MKEKKKILPQMFDVRPVDKTGDLDLEKINKMEKIVSLSGQNNLIGDKLKADIRRELEKEKMDFARDTKNDNQHGIGTVGFFQEETKNKKVTQEDFFSDKEKEKSSVSGRQYQGKAKGKLSRFALEKKYQPQNLDRKKIFLRLGIGLVAVVIVMFTANVIVRGLEIKRSGLAKAEMAMGEILAAKDSIKSGNFSQAAAQFSGARGKLNQVSAQFDGIGSIFIATTKYLPYLSKISSGSHLVRAGDDISQVGILSMDMLNNMDNIKAGIGQGTSISYLKLFQDNENNLRKISTALNDAQDNLNNVNVDDIPKADRAKFSQMKQTLPEINKALVGFLGQEKIFNDILGGNGPRKYLFLFQNNQEMRATGGFIGSYGLLDIFNGHVRNFFIDGIYNPDGQLQTKIIPPVPIQKISANWSLHDSNWFPNFPTSAEKAAWFYEKSGGPTVDGVITMTPTVMQKLLELTGPIDMPEYGIVVDKDNFIQSVQYQVEVDYDKQLNHPKKILSDLAPKIFDRILNLKNFSDMEKAMNVMLTSFNEKQILIYSKNPDIEKILSDNHWSGEILNTPKDYLSVINTNINGFKTDGVISENINHQADIQSDGSIIDTVTVRRHHNGGDTPYEWWNQVNADYMRVYVPAGSQLLSADGQTRETDLPPLDYKALGYVQDPQVQKEEESAKIDPGSGTKIYTDNGKTVFANWVYVSPKETVTIKYSYLLPFKIKMDSVRLSDTYSLLAQKQSGSLGSGLTCEVDYPASYKTIWQSPDEGISRRDDLPNNEVGIKIETDLKTDKFIGIAFTR